MKDILSEISNTLRDLGRSEEVQRLIDEALSGNTPVADVVEKGLRAGLEQVGAKYEAGEYFLAELLFAASTADEMMKNMRPLLKAQSIQKKGKIVLGTVRGDMHDIGKNIFKMMAEAAGFAVDDLNVDVEPEAFVQRSREDKPDILGLSCLLTTALPEIGVVIGMLKERKVRSSVTVLIGGNAVTREFGREVEADAVALNAIEGVNFCKGAVKR